MPPFVPRKRHSPSPEAPPAKRQATRAKVTPKSATNGPKPSLFDAIDAPSSSKSTVAATKALLASLEGSDDSSLSDVSSDEFEDVPLAQKRSGTGDEEQDGGDDDEEMDWEDAIAPGPTEQAAGAADGEIEDLSISLNDDGSVAASKSIDASGSKKGPSKRERIVRLRTHCLHVQALMWHNAVRNSWLNDKELYQILVTGLSDGVKKEITRWKDNMGIPRNPEEEVKTPKGRRKDKKTSKGKEKSKEKRAGRDWGLDADRLEKGVPNLSRGDPLLRLLKVLTAYWRKRFTITAPSLRKQGYMPLKRLTEEVKAWKKNKANAEAHGERIESKQAFLQLAKKCEGSRDVGSQLFTALMRAIGLEARMVANLQPSGIGWSKHEEARPKRPLPSPTKPTSAKSVKESESDSEPAKKPRKSTNKAKTVRTETPSRKSDQGSKTSVINLDDDDSGLSSVFSELDNDDDDDASLIDVTESMPSKKKHKKYDRDLAFPIYWTEVLSPVTKTFIPVDPVVLSTVASNQDLLSTFEPRGKRADQAKQVMCYTIAHSSDGSAKDVTVRYLKRHQLPGRTKGYRMPVEKIAVYNKRGKVKKHEDYDWFKTVMSSFERPQLRRTAADALEDSTDLKPYKPASEKPKMESESLQWYKQSAEYVLSRHLRREEAILPEAKSVKSFTAGKGDNATEEPVYRRSDVVATKTVESWHKEGREVKFGEQPLKMVTVRAVTLVRKREMEDVERETGEKLKQGLYAIFQTDWIIPPPIKNGVIPRNAFGNMDVYVSTMVPKGAVHVPLRGTARICRKLDIDYAEACTGFEFGNRRAVPVITGVVIARENEDAVIDAWEIEEEEKRRKEDVKREALCLGTWRKFLMGLRIVQRMQSEYGGAGNNGVEVNPFVKRAKRQQHEDLAMVDLVTPEHEEEDDGFTGGGGFFLPGEEEDELADSRFEANKPSAKDLDAGGGFMMDNAHDEKTVTAALSLGDAPVTPMSLQSAHKRRKAPPEIADIDDDEDAEDAQLKGTKRTSAKSAVGGARASSAKVKATPKPKPPPKSRGTKAATKRATKQIVISDTKLDGDEDDSRSGVSDLSDLTSKDAGDSDAGSGAPISPQVVIMPRKGHKPATSILRGGGRKAAPVKSRYFNHDGDATDNVDDFKSQKSEQEVVKPRKTTARTKTLKGNA